MTIKIPAIEIFTERGKLAAGQERTIDVLVRITPPKNNAFAANRPKLNVSMVLDRSGSMGGTKIEEAKDAAKYCIDQLLSTDRVSTVIFDDAIDVLIPSQLVEDKERLKRAINSIQVNGSTALHEAWIRGGLQVSEHLDNDAINRVLLITDGQANVGETRVDRIVEQARQLSERGVSTSTIGIGRDFNEDLLIPMAEAGQGNSWHVEEPQDMVRIFETELQGLVNQTGHTVTFGIVPAAGVSVADVLNDFETDGPGRYKLPNLQSGSKLDIVVRLRIPAQVESHSVELARFDLAYIGQESKLPETVAVKFAPEFAAAEVVDSMPENADVAPAVQLLMNARARREAMERIDRHDFAGAANAISMAAMDSEVLFSRLPSPMLAAEFNDLGDLKESLRSRENDALSRKKMAYRRESLRKNK